MFLCERCRATGLSKGTEPRVRAGGSDLPWTQARSSLSGAQVQGGFPAPTEGVKSASSDMGLINPWAWEGVGKGPQFTFMNCPSWGQRTVFPS